MRYLLQLFHLLPDGIKLFLRSFKKQEAELYELNWLVEKGTIAVDVGGNNGAYTYALSRLVGKNGKVYSVEPIEELALYLRRAIRQLRLPAQVEQCCLSSDNGKRILFIPTTPDNKLMTGLASLEHSNKSCGVEREVVLKRMDDLLLNRKKRVSFIKCDVEGHELDVFKGGLEILKTDRPNILVEIEQKHISGPIYDHFNFFIDQKYKGYFLDGDNQLRDLEDFNISIYQTDNSDSKIDEKYVYNFIFLPTEAKDAITLRNTANRQET